MSVRSTLARLWHIEQEESNAADTSHVIGIRHYSTVLELRVDGQLAMTTEHSFFHFFKPGRSLGPEPPGAVKRP